MRRLVFLVLPFVIVGCAQTDTMRVSANEMIISTSAAPICGGQGAARVAQKMAAIETIRAGYDRYVILDARRSSNIDVVQMPGSYNTSGSVSPYGSFRATTTYTPGPSFVSGTHDQSIAVRMFKNGQQGASSAISARDALGPKWASLVKSGVATCSD